MEIFHDVETCSYISSGQRDKTLPKLLWEKDKVLESEETDGSAVETWVSEHCTHNSRLLCGFYALPGFALAFWLSTAYAAVSFSFHFRIAVLVSHSLWWDVSWLAPHSCDEMCLDIKSALFIGTYKFAVCWPCTWAPETLLGGHSLWGYPNITSYLIGCE